MIKKKSNSKKVGKHKIMEDQNTSFSWIFSKQRSLTALKFDKANDQERLLTQDQNYEKNENESNTNKAIIDIKGETCNLTIKEIATTIFKELGFNLEDDNCLHLIQNKFSRLNICQNLENEKENEEDPPQFPPNFLHEKNREVTVSQYYINRKKNSKISDEFKVRLVLDARRNSLSIAEICKKYFICDTTVRSIIKEVKNCKQFQMDFERRMSRRRIEQGIIQKSISKCLCTS